MAVATRLEELEARCRQAEFEAERQRGRANRLQAVLDRLWSQCTYLSRKPPKFFEEAVSPQAKRSIQCKSLT